MRTGLLIAFVGALISPIVTFFLEPTTRTAADAFFFERQQGSLLAFALVCFVGWNRRQAFAALPAARPTLMNRLATTGIALPAVALLLWSRFVAAFDLYSFSLLLLALAACVHSKGPRAMSVLRLPMAVSPLVLPLPSAAYNELVWLAQRAATDGAAWVLESLGRPIQSGSMLIRLEPYDFWVIESCSGLRAAELLTLVVILVLELSSHRSRLDELLILLAAPLALLLNTLRIVAVVLYDTATANDLDHVTQGLIAVFAGTLILFGLQRAGFPWLAEPTESSSAAGSPGVDSGSLLDRVRSASMGEMALAGGIAASVLLVPSWPTEQQAAPPIRDDLPTERGGWTSEELESTRLFFNSLPIGRSLHRRYERPQGGDRRPLRVDLYVAQIRRGQARASLSSSKFGWLGPDWEAAPTGRQRIWQIARDGDWYLAERGNQQAVSLVWSSGPRSGWLDLIARAIAFDRMPARDVPLQRVYRLSTPVRGARSPSFAIENAELAIQRFLDDFAPSLGGTSSGATQPPGIADSKPTS